MSENSNPLSPQSESARDRPRLSNDTASEESDHRLWIEEVGDPTDLSPGADVPTCVWVPKIHSAPCVFAWLAVGDARLGIARLPPSYFDISAGPDRVVVAFGLDPDHLSVVNGRPVPLDSFGIGGPGSRCVAHWPSTTAPAQSFALLDLPVGRIAPFRFPSSDLFTICEPTIDAMERIRSSICAIVAAPDRDAAAAAFDELVEAIGAGLDGGKVLPDLPALAAKGYLETIAEIDRLLSSDLRGRIQLDDVARDLKLSRRTIHNVLSRVRGLTLQNYDRILRLRAVRAALLHDPNIRLVKQAAMRHGFAHQGRFAFEYTQYFGEAPSATLERRAEIVSAS